MTGVRLSQQFLRVPSPRRISLDTSFELYIFILGCFWRGLGLWCQPGDGLPRGQLNMFIRGECVFFVCESRCMLFLLCSSDPEAAISAEINQCYHMPCLYPHFHTHVFTENIISNLQYLCSTVYVWKPQNKYMCIKMQRQTSSFSLTVLCMARKIICHISYLNGRVLWGPHNNSCKV